MEKRLVKIILLFILNITFFAPSSFAKPIYVVKKSDGSILITNRTPPKGVNAIVYTGQRIDSNSFSKVISSSNNEKLLQGGGEFNWTRSSVIRYLEMTPAGQLTKEK